MHGAAEAASGNAPVSRAHTDLTLLNISTAKQSQFLRYLHAECCGPASRRHFPDLFHHPCCTPALKVSRMAVYIAAQTTSRMRLDGDIRAMLVIPEVKKSYERQDIKIPLYRVLPVTGMADRFVAAVRVARWPAARRLRLWIGVIRGCVDGYRPRR